jgi:hypothetical protein
VSHLSGPSPPAWLFYDLVLGDGVVSPDGFDFLGTFYEDGKSYLGQTIDAFEGDTVTVRVANNGAEGAGTHCE